MTHAMKRESRIRREREREKQDDEEEEEEEGKTLGLSNEPTDLLLIDKSSRSLLDQLVGQFNKRFNM